LAVIVAVPAAEIGVIVSCKLLPCGKRVTVASPDAEVLVAVVEL
jgi:hypothetical protein